ncbi:MAG: hypothetical protein APF81_21635 [Desulfosporosinus sp. BRH_c37]|nr:MAG: hypothetical protein APF81_21635 [Desulfosporosinus sp. BRH_c37]
MANFKIFQDNPDQVKVKIFGGNNAALNTDSSGNLTITSTGLAVEPPTGGLLITSAGLAITSTGLAIEPPTGGLLITSAGLAITSSGLAIEPPTGGLLITSAGLAITSTGLAIEPPTGGLLITSPGLSIISATTDVSATLANITDTTGSGDTTYTVLGVREWTFGVVNESLDLNAQALVKMQISPDGTNWLDEAGPVTINQNSLTTLVTSIFLKYARVFYSAVNAASAVTLNVFFQGEL